MIELKDVGIAFHGHTVLENINLQVRDGETIAIIGPSGSGKSTLLRMIIGLLRPTAGEVWVDDEQVDVATEDRLNELRKKMGMVFQYSALFDSMSVGENVAFGLRQHTDKNEAEIKAIVAQMLDMVGLSGREDVMPEELSGGMKKRVSLARAIAVDPSIVLYDEPTAGLDPIMSATIDQLIINTQRLMKVTSLVVTHDMSSAFHVADRIAMIYDKRIVETGTPQEIERSTLPIVQQFIHGWLDKSGKGDQ